ncbi:MAG: c-type cytochrome [Bacteroidetes bacterium]|nr:c-type cytochrome [Bacteroidota bacterium]
MNKINVFKQSAKIVFAAILFLLAKVPINAAAGDALSSVMKITGILTLLIIIVVLWLVIVIPDKSVDLNQAWKKFKHLVISKSTLATPIENEQEILMDHDYDGIKELDNKVPPIFNLLFYGTIIMAIIYIFQYHLIGTGNIMQDEYQEEVQLADMQRNLLIRSGAFLTEQTVTQLTDNSAIAAGQDIFMKNCASCHGFKGEGLIGPNLTDQYWINGGGIKNIFRIVRDGVQQKGMISWQSQLAPKQIQEVSSFIMSLEGTNPSNGKAPEGEQYSEESKESI